MMLAKCIKDLICNGETINSFTCGNIYELEEEEAGYVTINDMNTPHWLSDGNTDLEFLKEYFKIIEFETEIEFGGRLPRPKIKESTSDIIEVEITNKNMSAVNANQSMQFDCPNCKHNQIKAAWNYVHNFCPHCGVKIIWNTDPEPTKLFD